MRAPPCLQAGSRVALVAPSGPLHDETDIEKALNTVRSLNWEPVAGRYLLERDGYLAGPDDHRLEDLNRFANDDGIDAIWCIRGGYGAGRLLDRIDYDAWRRRPKTLIGYSDITALHSAIGRAADVITYHGPTARATLTPFSRDSLRNAVTRRDTRSLTAPNAVVLRAGCARGRLVGGNLALVASLIGTPYAPSFHDAILVLEDVSEQVYRIDRMLTQLRLAGALAQLAGIAFGQFTEIPADADAAPRSLDTVFAEIADRCAIPCVANIPLGHVADQWTLPLGAMATLDADSRTLILD